MQRTLKPLLIISLSFFVFKTHSQIITDEVTVEAGEETTLQYQGVEKLKTTNEGIEVTGKVSGDNLSISGPIEVFGKTSTSTLDVSGGAKVNGLLEAPNGVRTNKMHYEFSRWVSIPAGATQPYVFATDFSAGFTIEVTLSGNHGSSASSMFSKKWVCNYYQYVGTAYREQYQEIYSLGTHSGEIRLKVRPHEDGSNRFVVDIINDHNKTMNTTVLIEIITRGTPTLSFN